MLPSGLGDPASNLQFLVPAYPKHVISANDESTENYARLGFFSVPRAGAGRRGRA